MIQAKLNTGTGKTRCVVLQAYPGRHGLFCAMWASLFKHSCCGLLAGLNRSAMVVLFHAIGCLFLAGVFVGLRYNAPDMGSSGGDCRCRSGKFASLTLMASAPAVDVVRMADGRSEYRGGATVFHLYTGGAPARAQLRYTVVPGKAVHIWLQIRFACKP